MTPRTLCFLFLVCLSLCNRLTSISILDARFLVSVTRYIRAIRKGEFAEALRVIREKVPFASVCGYACPFPAPMLGFADLRVQPARKEN